MCTNANTKHQSQSKSKSKPVGAAQCSQIRPRLAGSRRFWLLAPGFMASGRFCLVPHRPPKFLGLLRRNRWAMGRQNFWACGALAMGDGSAQCTGRKTTRRPAPSLQAGELSRSSS